MNAFIDEILSELDDLNQETTRRFKIVPNYFQLRAQYPFGSLSQVKSKIGGRVNSRVIRNTCVIRVSRALNYTGHPIPRRFRGLRTIRGGDGKWYAIRVREFKNFLIRTYGPPDAVYVNRSGSNAIPRSFRNKKGIILFEVNSWNNATGHVTLWDGNNCVANDCYWHLAQRVYLWQSSELLNPFI